MPARGTEISPVPVLGTTPLRAQISSRSRFSGISRLIRLLNEPEKMGAYPENQRSPYVYHPVQLRTSLYNFVQDKKNPSGPTTAFPGSRFSNISRLPLPSNEPENIRALPENQRLMPENEPENFRFAAADPQKARAIRTFSSKPSTIQTFWPLLRNVVPLFFHIALHSHPLFAFFEYFAVSQKPRHSNIFKRTTQKPSAISIVPLCSALFRQNIFSGTARLPLGAIKTPPPNVAFPTLPTLSTLSKTQKPQQNRAFPHFPHFIFMALFRSAANFLYPPRSHLLK